MKTAVLLLLIVLTMAVNPSSAQKKSKASPLNGKGPIGSGRAGNGPISAHWKVSSDLDAELAKYKPTPMPFKTAGLTAREREMVDKLVQASRYLESIYWRQSDPEALNLYHQLAASKSPRDEKIRRFLFINASRFDLLKN